MIARNHIGSHFLKRMPNTEKPAYFEVRRILKAKIDAEKLADIKEKLVRYGTAEPESESYGRD